MIAEKHLLLLHLLLFCGVCLQLATESVAGRSLPMMSNCTYSYGTDFTAVAPHSKTPTSIFDFQPLAEPSLEVINFGFGTTATNGVYYRDLHKYKSGCHWTHCSGGGWKNYLVEHFERVRHCAQKPNRAVDGPCDSALWVSQLKEVLVTMLTKGPRLLGDNPMSFVFNEVLTLAPNVIVEHTLRNPVEWVLRRIDAHGIGDGDDLLCDPAKMPSHNPFDILPCIRNSSFVMDNIIFMKKYIGIDQSTAHKYFTSSGTAAPPTAEVQRRVRLVGHYFAQFNRHVLEHTKEENYFPTCLWDSIPHYVSATKQHHHHGKWKPKPHPAKSRSVDHAA